MSPTDTVVVASHSSNALFPFLPRWLKAVGFVFFLLHFRSWPTYWHWKVWRPALLSHFLSWWRGPTKHLRMMTHIGKDPLRVVSRKKFIAALDDIDYNGHLSNSCYAKNLDASRMLACCDFFTPIFTVGGWTALGGGYYSFIKEIPAFAQYEIEVTIGGYGDKWLYLVGTFITRPSKSAAAKSKKTGKSNDPPLPPTVINLIPTGPSATATPGATPLPSGMNTPATMLSNAGPRADGAVVHCISVSTYCFKLGRLTLPPALVLSFCGYGKASNWERFEKLHKAGPAAMSAWLKGGWKETDPDAMDEFAAGKPLGEKGERMRENLMAFAT